MLTQPENTIKLSDEQLLAIEETKSRLTNLEAEISIANKNLKGIKLENEKAIKEKIATEELLANLNVEVAKLSEEKERLINKVAEGETLLAEIAETDRVFKEEHAKAKVGLSAREIVVRDSESKLSSAWELFRTEKSELEVAKDKLIAFKEKLLSVINTL